MAVKSFREILAWVRRELAAGHLKKRDAAEYAAPTVPVPGPITSAVREKAEPDDPADPVEPTEPIDSAEAERAAGPEEQESFRDKGGSTMTKHEIEEAVNQGRCRLDIVIRPDQVRITLTGPDAAPVADGEEPLNPTDSAALAHARDGLRDAYRILFNRVEAAYSQKLCRVSSVRVSFPQNELFRDALPQSFDEGAVLTEEAARLLDPLGNLRPGIPVTLWDGEENQNSAMPENDNTALTENANAAAPVTDGASLPEEDVATVVDPASPPEGEPVPMPGEEPLPTPDPVPEKLLEEGVSGFPEILEHYQASLTADLPTAEGAAPMMDGQN
ncbi:MAG: hypothetical protein IJT94_06410 [Oscillibacter sp.]|nr:hypothetical protein [Oscillibacter sp.]